MSETDRLDLELVAAAARDAGALALRYFHGGARRWMKSDETSVTEADIAVDELLRERLTAARPGYGWLSEERADDGSRLSAGRSFVVDPIDGTRAFIERTDEWLLSVAVVSGDASRVGVLFNPVRGEMWSASTGNGAFLDGRRLRVSDACDLEAANVVASRKAMAQAGLAGAAFAPQRRYMKSLAHRLARVASGEIDAALASDGSADWDLAAAILLVEESGGLVTSLDGAPIRLNGITLRHPPFLAAGPRLHGAILEAAEHLEPAARTGPRAGR